MSVLRRSGVGDHDLAIGADADYEEAGERYPALTLTGNAAVLTIVISTKARRTVMPLDTLDGLGNVLFTLDAEDLPEPSELARALYRLRRPEGLTAQPGLLVEVAAAITQAARCWQHGFIAGEVAYADACEEPRWPNDTIVAAWVEHDQRSYSADPFAQRWYHAGWLAGWGER